MEETQVLESASEPQAPKGALFAIFVVALVDMLGFGLVIPLLPFYARHFSATPVQVTLLFSIFSACQFVATPILGSWSDRVGRRPILIFSLIGSAAGYALLGYASQHQWTSVVLGLWMVYLSRIIDGLTAGNISAAQAYISDITTAENRTKGMGMLGAAFGLGFSIGPAAGGILAAHFTLATPAWVACGMAVFAAILAFQLIHESRKHTPSEATNYFHPRQFLPLLQNRPLMTINIGWFVAMASFVAVDSAIVMYLTDIFHFDTHGVAYFFLLIGVVIIITQGRLVGPLGKRFGEWKLCITGLIFSGVSAIMTAMTIWYPLKRILITSAIIGAFGRSLFQPTISALVSHHSDPRYQGRSFGFFQGVGTLARVAGPLLAGYIYAYHASWPWIMSAGFLLATALWLGVLRMQEAKRPQTVSAYTPEH